MGWPADWGITTLGKAATWYSGGTPRTSENKYWGGEIPWIGSGSLTEFRIRTSDRTLTPLGAENGTRLVDPGTVIIVVRGMSLKSEFRMGITQRQVAFGQDCKALVAADGVDPEYLAYSIKAQTGHILDLVDEAGHGTGRLNTDQMKALQIGVPPPSEQHAIAETLGSLDDKIESIDRSIHLADRLGEEIFQRDFVDRDYLPNGWANGTLQDLLILQRGFDLPSKQRTPGGFPVMAASGPNGTHDKFMVKGPGITTGRSGVLGRVFYVESNFWPLNTSLWVREFRRASPSFAFYLLRHLDLARYNAGSAVPTLNRNHVHNLPMMVPSEQAISNFDSVVSPLLELVEIYHRQRSALSALLDALLPELVSGRIRVPGARASVAVTS